MALAVAVVSTLAASVTAGAPAAASPPSSRDVTAVLFQWNWPSVAKACTDTLGPAGYGYVQVSPPEETIQGSQWWTSYQPVSYKIGNRQGTRAQFASMVSTCHAAGVKVIADSVINHMSAGSGTGTAGTTYSKYTYPGYYQDQDFHSCRTSISDYTNRWQVQNCELVGLADLDTGSAYVQTTIAHYLDDLRSLGVDGFRIDAAKHIAATDLQGIKSRTSDPNAYWVQEVIYGGGEPVQPDEYTGTGDVHEFRYGTNLKRVFTSGNLKDLSGFGQSWGMLPSANATVFVDNHDTERNGSTLTYKDGATYTLANVFMLGWSYGAPAVHSGYEFSNNDAGPPNGGQVNACYTDGWKCQHAWAQISGMVGFHNAVRGTGVTNWWDDGGNRIAFGRGSAGYLAINHTGSAFTQTFQTSLPAGTYCDVTDGRPSGSTCAGQAYTVDGSGRVTATVGAQDAVALHIGAKGTATTSATSASFAVNASTVWGQNVYVVGNTAALGGWDPAKAVPLSSASYPVWTGTVSMPAGTAFEYKYVKKDGSGTVTWESGGNRTATVPSSGTVTLSDTWRG
ncbi:MAG: carbohydrate-binding module family 20 domain-containing protein [Angustibacter sp.]